jgi:hypothetical protein
MTPWLTEISTPRFKGRNPDPQREDEIPPVWLDADRSVIGHVDPLATNEIDVAPDKFPPDAKVV